MTNAIPVAIGGALGALLRYGLQLWTAARFGDRFPYGTLAINLTGAFLIGFLMTAFAKPFEAQPAWRLFAVVGILGGYTTFSSFTWETWQLVRTGAPLQGLVYVTTSILVGLLAVIAGAALGERF